MKAEVFSKIPNELKTIEVDVERKIFKVNGESFGDSCTGFSISCEAGTGFQIYMDMTTTVRYASYKMDGMKVADHTNELRTIEGHRRNYEILTKMPLENFANIAYWIVTNECNSLQEFKEFLKKETPEELLEETKRALNNLQCQEEDQSLCCSGMQ